MDTSLSISKTLRSEKLISIFLKEKIASIDMNRGILASMGKVFSGSGYLSKNLLNCLICLLQNDKT